MNKIPFYISILFLIISCTKEVDSPALLSKVAALQSQVSTLQSKIDANSALQTTLTTRTSELQTALANYEASQASLSASTEAYSALNTSYVILATAYAEIVETYNLWFYNTEGVFSFYVLDLNNVRVADYVWELGTDPNADGDDGRYGVPYFSEYIYSGGCYGKSEATSLGADSEVYISQASSTDMELTGYNIPADNYSAFDININYTFINQTFKVYRRTGGIYFLISFYDTSWNPIGTIGNLANSSPNPYLTTTAYSLINFCN